MVKQLLAAAFVGAMAFGAYAEQGSVVFTYADNNVGYWGKGKAETYDVAMCINDPGLAGKKITSVTALVNTDEGMENISLWLSKELNLVKENKVNVNAPDIMSVTPTVSDYALTPEWTVKQLAATFDEPYTMTADPVYVGYSFDMTAKETVAQQNPLILSTATNPEGFYFHASKSVLKWKNYTGTLAAVACIYVTIEGEFAPYEVGVKSIAYTYAPAKESYNVPVTISNLGLETVTSLDYTYTVDGDTFFGQIDLEEPIAPDFVNSTVVELPCGPIKNLGLYDLSLTITKVNGNANASAAATGTTQVEVIPFVPVHRPLVEEFTGTWCQWCTRGYVAMELINKFYGDKAVGIAYHNGDPMTVTNNYPVSISGFPAGSVNRSSEMDPYYGTYKSYDFGIQYNIEDVINEVALGDIDLSAEWTDSSLTTLNVTADVRFVSDLQNANYQVGYVLACNGLQDDSWVQINAYSRYPGEYDGTYLEELTTWPNSVPGLVFNDVVINADACKGVAETVPATIVKGEYYTSTYSFEVGDSFKNTSGNFIPFDKNNLYVAAFIIDKKTGRIVNANKISADNMTGVENTLIAPAADVEKTTYYDLTGRRVGAPAPGVFVKVEKLTDGSTRSSKVVVK